VTARVNVSFKLFHFVTYVLIEFFLKFSGCLVFSLSDTRSFQRC